MGKVPVQPVKTAFLRVWLRVAYPGGARAPCPARLCVPPGPRFTERTRGEGKRGRRGGVPQTAGTCRALLTRREALGPGGQVAGVAPPQQGGGAGAPARGPVVPGPLGHTA